MAKESNKKVADEVAAVQPVYKAILRNVRVSARKARLVVDMVRGKTVSDAIDMLKLTNKKASRMVRKTLESAIANARSNPTIDVDRLIVAETYVGEAGMWKRYIPRAQGRAGAVRRRLSHITIKVKEL